MGKKLARSDAGDALRRIADHIERLQSKMSRGLEGLYAEIGTIRGTITAMGETMQRELWDREDAEMVGGDGPHTRRITMREKVEDIAFELPTQKEQLGNAIGEIQAGAQRLGSMEENIRLEVTRAVLASMKGETAGGSNSWEELAAEFRIGRADASGERITLRAQKNRQRETEAEERQEAEGARKTYTAAAKTLAPAGKKKSEQRSRPRSGRRPSKRRTHPLSLARPPSRWRDERCTLRPTDG